MMYPSESLARAAREQYHSLRHSNQAWVPFFPPFTQAELPPPPAFAKNPLHSDWEELPNEHAERISKLRLATAILIGCTMLAMALIGLFAFPFVQEQTGFSLLSTEDATECWCDKGPLPSGQAFARGSDVAMELSGQPGINGAIQGSVGILLQTTEARSISCMALRASPGVQAWDWRVEGRPTQANATRTPSGRHICVQFNQTLPWPASYVTMKFRHSQPSSTNDSLTANLKQEPQALPFNISCSNPAHHREPFAVFPFLERADLNTDVGIPAASATFSTLWNINVTAPASFAVNGAVGDMPLMDLAQLDGGPKSSLKTALVHVFRATAPSVPSITLTGRN